MSEAESPVLGSAAPRTLAGARDEIHHAVQIVSSVGVTLLDPAPDDSHPNLGWSDAYRALVGRLVPGPSGIRAALRVPDLTLLLLAGGGGEPAVADHLALAGRTLDEAYDWLAGAIRLRHKLEGGLTRPAYDLPAHPVARGAALTGQPREAFEELGCWLAHADAALRALAAATAGASEVRCWPHHLDIATLITVERGADAESSRTIGVGLSPGDESYREPYWYVSPWPYPEADALPELAGRGFWHTSGFTAAILTGTDLVGAGGAEDQRDRLRAFLDSAIAGCRQVLAS